MKTTPNAETMAQIDTSNLYDSSTPRLDIKEIAKLIRAQIKAEVKAGRLPVAKYGVTISRYSMGQSLSVKVSDLAANPYNPEWIADHVERPHDYPSHDRNTAEVQALLRTLERIANRWNYDRSQVEVDHFDVNYYTNADLDTSWSIRMREEAVAAFRVAAEVEQLETAKAVLVALACEQTRCPHAVVREMFRGTAPDANKGELGKIEAIRRVVATKGRPVYQVALDALTAAA